MFLAALASFVYFTPVGHFNDLNVKLKVEQWKTEHTKISRVCIFPFSSFSFSYQFFWSLGSLWSPISVKVFQMDFKSFAMFFKSFHN